MRLFNASGDYISVGTGVLDTVGKSGWVSVWARPNWAHSSGNHAFFTTRNLPSGDIFQLLSFGGTLIAGYYNDGEYRVITTSYSWSAGDLIHLLVVLDDVGNTTKCFLNGAQVGSTVSTLIAPSLTDAWYIGNFPTTGFDAQVNFDGDIGEVATGDTGSTPLTDAEAAAIYADRTPGNEIRGCINYWPLEGDDSPEPNIVGANTGTVNSADKSAIHAPVRPPSIGYWGSQPETAAAVNASVAGEAAAATAAAEAAVVTAVRIVSVAGEAAGATSAGLAATVTAVRVASVAGEAAAATATVLEGAVQVARTVAGEAATAGAAALEAAIRVDRTVPGEAASATAAGQEPVITAVRIASVAGEAATATAAAHEGTIGTGGTVSVAGEAAAATSAGLEATVTAAQVVSIAAAVALATAEALASSMGAPFVSTVELVGLRSTVVELRGLYEEAVALEGERS